MLMPGDPICKQMNSSISPKVRELLEAGQRARKSGDHATALAAYEAAAAADPQRPNVLLSLASILRELGRLDQAEPVLQRLLAVDPANFGALIERGHVLRRRGDHAGALAAYEAAAAANPQRSSVLLSIASVLRELGRLDQAEAALQRLLEVEPTNFGALIERGHVLRRRGDHAGALAAYEAAAAANPQQFSVLLSIASVLHELGHLDQAEAALQRLLAVDPGNARALTILGSLRMAAFRLDEAEQCFKDALEAQPNNIESRIQLGRLARRRGRGAEALAYFNSVLSLNSVHFDAQIQIATELINLGRIDEAGEYIQRIISDKPTDVRAWIQLGRFHRSSGDNKLAFDAFQKAFQLQPNDPDSLVEMAIEQRTLGNPKESLSLLYRALEINPSKTHTLHRLAEHAWMAEKFEESLDICHRAIQIQPHELWSYIHASRAATELGRQEEALNLLSQARKTIGHHPEIEATQIALFRRTRHYKAAESTLANITGELQNYFCIWEQRIGLAISIGAYQQAEQGLQNPPTSTPHERSRACFLRGRLAEAQWQLETAAAHYKEALAINPGDSSAHNEMATLCLKLHDIDGGYFHLRKRTILSASTRILRGGNLNDSQSHLGHLYEEYALDRTALSELQAIQTHPFHQQIAQLLKLIREKPDYTPAALALLIALRRSGELTRHDISPSTAASMLIPTHIAQYWDNPDPPPKIVDLMKSWQQANPTFAYTKFDKNSAAAFLKANFSTDVLLAFSRTHEPAQAADVFRLAYLYLNGGFYCDPDDWCFESLATFLPPSATLIGYLEGHGSLANNFLGVVRRHPIIKRALALAVQAINRSDHDETWLSTGPGLLSRAFAHTLAFADANSYSRLLETMAIFDFNWLQRYVGFHCPADYKRTANHWKHALRSRPKLQMGPTSIPM
jgi:tetratricopeptide (TPR) repeat protein